VNGHYFLSINDDNCVFIPAGKNISEDELEQMLEQGNSAVFTEGVTILAT